MQVHAGYFIPKAKCEVDNSMIPCVLGTMEYT